MEDLKEKIPIIIAVIIIIALMIGAFYFLCIHKIVYYTQIDNTKIESGTKLCYCIDDVFYKWIYN